MAYHASRDEPRIGSGLLIVDRSGSLLAQVIAHDTATYPGDRETLLSEILENVYADAEDVVRGEPALTTLKEIKLARCKIRKRVIDGAWLDWDGGIPSRNVSIIPVSREDLVQTILHAKPPHPVSLIRGERELYFDAGGFEKVNAVVGVKGSGKSHFAKLLLGELVDLGAPCWVFDVNREFVNLPGADAVRVGDNLRLSLAEVGFSFLSALVEDLNPLQDVSRGAFEYEGRRLVRQQLDRQGYATVEYLLDRAVLGQFHSHDAVNRAIETRLEMAVRTGLFSDDPSAETLSARFDRVTLAGGFLVFDLADLPSGRLRALARGLNRRLDAICEEERASGRGRYPFVFFEEAHFYANPTEILNLVTRGRHLGLTMFFVTNTPGELPDVVFRQLDNLVVTGLTHSADLRTIGKSALTDEETLQSLASGLDQTEALVVGRATNGFPVVVNVSQLPHTTPATGVTRSFWDGRARTRSRRGAGPSQRTRRPRAS